MVLNDLPNIGPVSLNRLLAEFQGDPCAILGADRRRLERVKGVGPETSASVVNWREHFDLAREEARLAQAGASFITARDGGSRACAGARIAGHRRVSRRRRHPPPHLVPLPSARHGR